MLNRIYRMKVLGVVPIGLILVVLSTGFLFGQWETDVRLTTDADSSYTSYNNAWCIAASGDTVHVVWYDGRDGNYEIYYKRSDDGGATWGADARLTIDTNWSSAPSVAVYGSEVHVVWEDDRDQEIKVYHKYSSDNGVTWGPDVLVTGGTGAQGIPSLAVANGCVHVAWVDFGMMGNSEIYYGRSTDDGATWETPYQISYASGYSVNPSIAACGSNVHIAWHDSRYGWWNNEIYYCRSADGGVTWGVETQLTQDTTFSNVPSIAVSGSNVHIAWEEMRDGNFEMYYKRSTDDGATWVADTRLTNDAGDSHGPSLVASGANLHLVWQENRDGNEEVYYMMSSDNGLTWGPDVRLTDDPNTSQLPSITVSGPIVHVVWSDERNSNWDIYYKRNPTGNTGVREYTGGVVGGMILAAAPNPFTQLTTVSFGIEHGADRIELNVYDALGRLVKSFDPGSCIMDHVSAITWDGTDHANRQLGGGVYFVRLTAGAHTATEKLLLVR